MTTSFNHCLFVILLVLFVKALIVADSPPSLDSPTRCTFEGGTMCGWQRLKTSTEWVLNDPSQKIPDFPRFDHTLKTYRGRFVFATNKKKDSYETAILQSPEIGIDAANDACLSFWLFTFHAVHNNFAVFVKEKAIFDTNARPSHRWEHVLIDFKRPAGKFKIHIQAYFTTGLVALDDIVLNSGRCPPRDFCSWEKGSPCSTLPDLDSFSAWKPRDAAVFGLPDHTLKSLKGRYLYLNTTGADSHNPVSRVFMQTRPPTEATCVTFWWSGRGVKSQLNAYMFTDKTILQDPLVSVATPEEDGLWVARTVNISSSTNWSLVFEGVAPIRVQDDSGIMIDDVEYTDGKCPPYNLCTFEEECLPWRIPENGQQAAFEVERAGSFNRLPRDHTTQTEDGYYLLFKSSGIRGKQSSLVLLEPERYECLSLWYYLPALSKGVQLQLQGNNITEGEGVWKRQHIQCCFNRDKEVVAISGTNRNGFVAIDDVLLNEEPCTNIPTTTSAPSKTVTVSEEPKTHKTPITSTIENLRAATTTTSPSTTPTASEGTETQKPPMTSATAITTSAPSKTVTVSEEPKTHKTPITSTIENLRAATTTTSPSTTPTGSEGTETQKSPMTSTTEEVSTTARLTSEASKGAPSTLPTPQCNRGYFECQDGRTCIPGVLLCDGVPDCPDGLDETCDNNSFACEENEFFCASRSPSACLPRSLLCDGREDCSDGSDEAMCHVCPSFLCLNDAICNWTSVASYPSCDCKLGNKGRRCEMEDKGKHEKVAMASTRYTATGIVIVLVVLVLAILFAIVLVKRRRAAKYSPAALLNPIYDASTEEIRLSK